MSTPKRLARIAGFLYLLVGIFGAAMLAALLFKVAPALNHFILRVLVDCALAVGQSVFTIALFLFYWRARSAVA